jgi:hypothetical protein
MLNWMGLALLQGLSFTGWAAVPLANELRAIQQAILVWADCCDLPIP